MNLKIDKSWHLATDKNEIEITEFEFQLWRVFYGFIKWQENCQEYVCGESMTGYELALLHIIEMNDRSKTIYDLCRLLNRDDPNNIQYGVTKLVKLGLIEKVKDTSNKKTQNYQITQKGKENTKAYSKARRSTLIELFKEFGLDKLGLEDMSKKMSYIKNIYDESSRLVTSYKSNN